ncbi:uncharacterized protein LOC133351657 isoform X2 [Lethenteron reissneri]|uniref:uncharacterized protein LOC133351657 isoform X2 n=1 Tax=Lethenteron reissneri TaxID=7753 RepID=UPI002AB5F430|nr:uncharacterized protein LOC133351657 isoform X2 [Lethenteron reissneri]
MALNHVEIADIQVLFGHDCKVIQSACGKYLNECSGQWNTLDSGRICLLKKGNFQFVALYKLNMPKGYICQVTKDIFYQKDERLLQFKSEGGENVALYFEHKNEFKMFVDALPKYTVMKKQERKRPKGGTNADISKPTEFQHLQHYQFDLQKQLMVVKCPAESAVTGHSASGSTLPRSRSQSIGCGTLPLAFRPLPEIPGQGPMVRLETHPSKYEPRGSRPHSSPLPSSDYEEVIKEWTQPDMGTLRPPNTVAPSPPVLIHNARDDPTDSGHEENVYVKIIKNPQMTGTAWVNASSASPGVTAQLPIGGLEEAVKSVFVPDVPAERGIRAWKNPAKTWAVNDKDPRQSLAAALKLGNAMGHDRSSLRKRSGSSPFASPAAANRGPLEEEVAMVPTTREVEERRVEITEEEKNVDQTEENVSPVPCPICFYVYPGWLIEEHARTCEEYSTDPTAS